MHWSFHITPAQSAVAVGETLTIGAVVVKVRKGKAFALKFDATRSFQHARRDMKRFVAGKKYADRPDLVQPNPDDAKLFETSS